MSHPSRDARADGAPRGTPIVWPFRAWLVVELLFGLASVAALVPRPQDTAVRFAWHIEPTVMAAALGGLYVATVPVLVLAALARRWETVRVIVPSAIAFTTLELVATLLHLDRFSVGTLPFAVWLASYVLPPPLFAAMFWYHERRSAGQDSATGLPRVLRATLVAVGAFLTVDALVAFAVPTWFSSSFPWTLTPLTARVLAGWLVAVGSLLLWIAHENDRDRARIATPLLVLLLPAVGVQVARFAGQVDASNPRLWIAVALFTFTAAVGISLGRGSWRATLR